MAKKTRTELSTLAINTNLPDNTTELITPTTERAQLTDERESVVNYKDDLGGATNAGKFLTVAVDGESLTMVDEPSGVPAWVTFATGLSNLMKLLSGTNNAQIQFFYDDAGVDTLGARISFDGTSKTLLIGSDFYTAQLSISNQFNFIQGGFVKLRIETTGDLTHNADIMALNAQQAFGSSPLYTFKFQGKVTGPSGGSYTFEEFANIKGGKENATENDKAGYLSFTTGIADGTLTERLRISSGGDVGIGTPSPSAKLTVVKSTRSSTLGASSVLQISDASAASQAVGDRAEINFYTNSDSLGGNLQHATIGIIKTSTTGNETADLYFGTSTIGGSPVERMRITSGGDVYIGNSSINTTETAIFLQKSGIITNVYAYSSGSINLMEFYKQSAGLIGTISYNGTDTLYNATSDYRLKEDLKDYNGIDFISKIKTYDFKWKNTEIRSYGVMAHELQEVFPNCVTGEKDALDDEGNIIPQGVDYSKIVPMLIKGVQEQQTIIADLINRLEALEA